MIQLNHWLAIDDSACYATSVTLRILRTITRHFARAAHAVQTASSRAEAARAIEASAFDIVLVDVMLPDGSGIELCARLRQQGCAVPVLLLTARSDVRDRVQGLDAGADALVLPLVEWIASVAEAPRRLRPG